jgi:hypothetical protein
VTANSTFGYAKTGDGIYAYQVLAEGAGDLVFVPRFKVNGEHDLNGVPDAWGLYRVAPA